jgi:hypothetical protein
MQLDYFLPYVVLETGDMHETESKQKMRGAFKCLGKP